MNASELALRDQIAFQLGLLTGKVLEKEEFDVGEFIDPIVEAAKKLTPID